MRVVLYNPEIPQNTGNIARTCAATRTDLYLIEPLGFELKDKYMKRAGLDYFGMVNITVLPSFDKLMEQFPGAVYHFASTKAPRSYTDVTYGTDDFLVFGCETKGLPESLLSRVYDRCIRVPMRPDARSLNLSNSVAVVLYEALRQNDFPGLTADGQLTGRQDEAAPWMDYI
ncbi:MAG: tRNA (uridine(34)/cytosine(34)/5-carboxymethylaminomethyluridine(34)-2'-O)-methyltransferase TrmL [Clostridiales bacterium]|nr:tRNA (uridine(34)/cytosine(34)/5-carboxymethylaminomethyluridine(34)-2'-O)-methyltransferase TrmL [Clostridiales bacterium]